MKTGIGIGILVLGVLLAGGAVLATGGSFFGDEDEKALEGVVARRGPLVISEIVRGNLAAKNSVTLRNEIEGRSTILTLIEEGTLVEEGDVIAELDTSALADRLVMQKIDEQQAQADATKAREQLAIQMIQNESDIAKAKLDLDFALLDLEKYTIEDGEWVHELKKFEETIKLSQEELSRAAVKLEWTKKLYDQGFAQGLELEADQAAVERTEVEIEQARRDKALQETYGHRRKLAELKSAVETMQRDVAKTEKQANAKLADFQAAEASTQIRWDLEKEKLKKIEEQLGKGKIIAPVRGMVVYARENSRWGSSEPVQEGGEVHERQEIATIPREGGMIVDASLHETVLKKVQIGQNCRITIDALPDRAFEGKVDFVAVLADSNAWFANPNQRIYRSEISIGNGVPEMRPGMSCSVEIMVAELQDVVYVPVQCVFFDGGETIAFVRKDGAVERRPVEVGLDNSKLVEVKTGLADGELVLLTPPPSFKPKATPTPEVPGVETPEGEVPGNAAPTMRPPAEGQPGMADGGFRGQRGEGATAGSEGKGGDGSPRGGRRPEGGGDGERSSGDGSQASHDRPKGEAKAPAETPTKGSSEGSQ